MSSLAVNKLNTVLIGGDSYGFIYIWNIDGYCSKEPTSQPPECMFIYYNFHYSLDYSYISTASP